MNDVDVIIVGSGPAGVCAALPPASAGRSVLVLERDTFPRHHIGESLLARTVPYLKRLGVWDRLHEQGYVVKPGALFVWGGRDEPFVLDMPEPGYSFQVPRASFDNLLLQEAVERGADVRQRCRVVDVRQLDDGVVVTAVGPDGEFTARARYVVDASGGNSLSARALGARSQEYDGARIAVSAYFTGATAIAEPHSGRIITEASANGWIWFIPLSPDTVSVGLVSDARRLRASASPRQALFEELATAGFTAGHLAEATATSDFQVIRYANHRMIEPKWSGRIVRVGDAAMFVDPLFSTGVHGAVYSGYMAGSALAGCLAGEVEPADAAQVYNAHCDEYFERTRETVRLLYGFHPGDTPFWKDRSIPEMTAAEAAESLAALGVPGAAIFHTMRHGLAMPTAFRAALADVVWPSAPAPVEVGRVLALRDNVEVRPGLVFHELGLVPGFTITSSDGCSASISIPDAGTHGAMLRELATQSAAGTGLRIGDHHSGLLAGALVSSGNASIA